MHTTIFQFKISVSVYLLDIAAAMSSQGSAVHMPNSDQSFSKADLTLYGSPVQIRPNRNVARRASSFVKMATEDHPEDNRNRPARLTRSDARRGSSFIRAMSEDVSDDNRYLGSKSHSLTTSFRRGSSFLMPGEEIHDDHLSATKSQKDIRRGSSFIRTADDSIDASKDIRRGSSLIRTIDDSLDASKDIRRGSSLIRTIDDSLDPSKDIRRGSSLIRTIDDSLDASKDIRRGSSLIKTIDDSLEEGAAVGRRLDVRRGSSFIRMISADINNEEMHSTGRLSSKPESRRGSAISKMMSEDNSEDLSSRRSSASVRRGSSFSRMISEENDADVSQTSGKSSDRSDISDNVRKSRRSLESISEYKTHTFSSASLYPSIEYSSMSLESTSDFSSDFAIRTSNEHNDDNTDRLFLNSSLSYLSWIESVNTINSDTTAPAIDDNRSGEWNSFWTNYNSSRNEYFSSPYLCPSNSGEDLSLDSNGSTQRGYTDKSASDSVVLTAEEINEAILCTQRLMDILRGAIKRSETEVILSKSDEGQNYLKEDKANSEDKTQKDKSLLKPSNNSCIDVILNHTGVADILKRVINKRRDVIMPPDEASTPKTSLSEWSISKK